MTLSALPYLIAAAPQPDRWTWENTAQVIVALIGSVAVGATVAGIREKWHFDRRDQWWKRVQWALEKVDTAANNPSVASAALIALVWLERSPLAHDEEKAMLQDISANALRDPSDQAAT